MNSKIGETKILCEVVSINEISEIEREIQKEIKRIVMKHQKSHLVNAMTFIEITIKEATK